MLDIDSLAVDPVAAESGVWANFMGARFLIARHNNEAGAFLRSKLALQNWDTLSGGGEEAEKVAADISAQVIANHILLNWEGVSKAGEPLEYTPELGLKYLTDPRFRDLQQFIENFSLNRSNYREKAEEEVADSVKDSAVS